jgi:hypothetical protein
VLWQSEEPTCFPAGIPLDEQMAAVDQYVVDGETTAPRKIQGASPSRELFEGVEISSGVPVMEVVINTAGKIESVVSLRQTSPEFDARLARVLRDWRFEPSKMSGVPICTRYIVTLRINWQ